MELIIFLGLCIVVCFAFVFYFEIEKIVDNTFEIGKYLDRQEKREIKFRKNLDKAIKGKK